MGLGDRLEVVGLVGVAEHSVDQSRIDHRSPNVGGQDRRLRDAALKPDVLDAHFPGLEPPTGYDGAQRIQDAVLGGENCFRGQAPLPGFCHVPGKLSGEVGGNHLVHSFRQVGVVGANPQCLVSVYGGNDMAGTGTRGYRCRTYLSTLCSMVRPR